jgi:predicted CXXCH cytochrome family protein
VKCTIHYITRKQRGGIAVKESEVEAEALMVGRGNDCAVHLSDPRVLLKHAEISLRSGDIYIAPQPGADVRLNGNLVQMTRVAVGDKMGVGPFELSLEENDGAGKVVIAVELVQPLGDDLNRVMGQAEIARGKLSARTLSWALALIVAVLMFAAPWVASWFHDTPALLMVLNSRDRAVPSAPTNVWTTGSISAAHRFFGDSCETCHVQPFVPVEDKTCVTCHDAVEHHADPKQFTFASFEDKSCQNCHKEHQGHAAVSLSDQNFCADCHKDFATEAPKSTLRSVSDFGTDHPEFRPTIVVDSSLHTVDRSKDISAKPALREDSSLKFPHNRHMRPGGVRHPERGNIDLTCAGCHTTDGGGGYMLPISFEEHCHQCHKLKFDTFLPDRELVHGKPEEMFKQVRDIYDSVGMRGGYEEPEAPALIRRRVGAPITADQKKAVLDWSAEKTTAVLNGRTGKGLCEGCHTTFQSVASGGTTGAGWGVEPVSASNVWYPKSKFMHGSHRDMECGSCHDARNSVESAEVLMPSIENCRACHGGEHAVDKVPSTCMDCHVFHRDDLEPMRVIDKHGAKSAGYHPSGMNAVIKTALSVFDKSAFEKSAVVEQKSVKAP